MAFAMIFPGQASQYVGMLAGIAAAYPSILADFNQASTHLGYDLWDLVQQGPKEELDQTRVTQPAVLTASVALWHLWQELGGAKPDVVAGHSLGEYSALVAADVLSFADALTLVTKRAELMTTAGQMQPGKMLIILGLDAARVTQLCEQAARGQVLSIANYNSPVQLVVAGDAGAIDRLADLAQSAGARRVLPAAVSVASHCALMAPSQAPMQEAMAAVTWHSMTIPVLQNASLVVSKDIIELQQALVEQLTHPVKWAEVIAGLQALGAMTFVECGPAKVLTGLMKRIDAKSVCYATDRQPLIESALTMVGKGCVNG